MPARCHYSSFLLSAPGVVTMIFSGGRMTILILHYFGKNAILSKPKLTVMHFHQIQEIANVDGTQTAGILYHCM